MKNTEIVKNSNMYYKDGRIMIVGDYLQLYNKNENCLEQNCSLVFTNLNMIRIDQFGIYLESLESNILKDNTWNIYKDNKKYHINNKVLYDFIEGNKTLVDKILDKIIKFKNDIEDGTEDCQKDVEFFMYTSITPIVENLRNCVKDGYFILNSEHLTKSQEELKSIILEYMNLKNLIIDKFSNSGGNNNDNV